MGRPWKGRVGCGTTKPASIVVFVTKGCVKVYKQNKEVGIMGRGDGRTRKGKIFKRSYGKTRPKTKVVAVKASTAAKKPAAKPATAKK